MSFKKKKKLYNLRSRIRNLNNTDRLLRDERICLINAEEIRILLPVKSWQDHFNTANLQGSHGNKIGLRYQSYLRLGFVLILIIGNLMVKSSDLPLKFSLSVYTILFGWYSFQTLD